MSPDCHQHHAESMEEPHDVITVICPKHGEHEHAIISNIDGHEGVWCQLCWLESLGPSLQHKTNSRQEIKFTPDD